MKKTALTYDTLTTFEKRYVINLYNSRHIERIEHAAYCANMNRNAHENWTDEDVFSDFLRILDVDGIRLHRKRTGVTLTVVCRLIETSIRVDAGRSAWAKGVAEYALGLIEELETNIHDGYVSASVFANVAELEKAMLNGAKNWKQYSESGCAFCYDHQIAKRLCAPWELRKTDYGRKDPNPRESWIDVQSRALYQAFQMVKNAIPNMIDFDEMEV